MKQLRFRPIANRIKKSMALKTAVEIKTVEKYLEDSSKFSRRYSMPM